MPVNFGTAKKIKSILIANRGEIACRIIRTCKELGIESIAIYSDSDENALHTKLADKAVHIGPSPANESYLRPEKIYKAARDNGADAIHPGYGFLSENAHFAELCSDKDLIFIGPSPASIRLFGDKVRARLAAQKAGVPIVPGTAAIESMEDATAAADDIGYPVIVKTQGGGGGMGISVARDQQELATALDMGRMTGASAFGHAGVYIEKYLTNIAHIEVQVFGDHHGNAVHLFERDCSVQRRNQKVIEEAPCSKFGDDIRARLFDAALKLVRQSGYENAGTAEFLVEPDGRFYFIELNSRIQVEHPVTEMVTGLDLIALQIAIAEGKPIPFKQEDIALKGVAIETRILAEDPESMSPSPGTVENYRLPSMEGVRVESGIETGSQITAYYDSLVCKIIAHAADRPTAIARLIDYLKRMTIEGPSVNLELPLKVLKSERFRNGTYTTAVIGELAKQAPTAEQVAALAAALYLQSTKRTPASPVARSSDNWWASGIRLMTQ